jgi:GT2 family glycosyltransferase
MNSTCMRLNLAVPPPAAIIREPISCIERPQAIGKFLFVGGEKFWVRGVTYGTFQPDALGHQFPSPDVVRRDFAAMARAGLNCVRVYTPPPLWLLTLAAWHGLRVMVGLPWEQHIAFLERRADATRILNKLREAVRGCAKHPAILCYAVGNEIPASVVRWYGRRRIERFLRQLSDMVRGEDRDALITYVNFPTTEYLKLPFLDFVSFNVYLESKMALDSYLARLQNIAGERPLLLAEIGLDSRRNGESAQSQSLRSQVSSALAAGCAGTFVFAWTDEWYRGGHNIEDWDFGLTTRERQPKAALRAVEAAFPAIPFPRQQWPKISVIVCSYNGSKTIDETLTAIGALEYLNYETIVVDDGSTDDTSLIAKRQKVRLIRTENRGLSSARNTGLHAASGEFVAYIDDDAYPDPDWLTYLASAFIRTKHAGIGGLNIAPFGDGALAACVANAPGGPAHVLLSDELAEHIPGCNMAFRREQLLAVGGFDPRFHVAGDDVDICWRLQDQGWTIGFTAAAVVWHHRRNSLTAYFKQQLGYAEAEALLAEKWPNKYNRAGHLLWQGRLYGRGVVESIFSRSRIYHGVWGSAPFQSIYAPSSDSLSSLTLMPEWYSLLVLLGVLSALGASWRPLLWASPLVVAGISLSLLQATRAGIRATFHGEPRSALRRTGLRLLVGLLHLAQPAVRLFGRIKHGMGPWDFKGPRAAVPLPTTISLWSERWEAVESRLSKLALILRDNGTPPLHGGEFDRWDLAVHGGLFGAVRGRAMVEEHGSGRQLCRFRLWPKLPLAATALLLVLTSLTGLALLDHAWVAGTSLGLISAALGCCMSAECDIAMTAWHRALKEYVCRDASRQMLTKILDHPSPSTLQSTRVRTQIKRKGLIERLNRCEAEPINN